MHVLQKYDKTKPFVLHVSSYLLSIHWKGRVHSKCIVIVKVCPHILINFHVSSQLMSTCHDNRDHDFLDNSNHESRLNFVQICTPENLEIASLFCSPHYQKDLSKSRQLVKNTEINSNLCLLGPAKSECSDYSKENSFCGTNWFKSTQNTISKTMG